MSKKQSNATKQANAQRAAERAAAIRREQEAKERRRRTLWVSLAVLAVIAVVVAIAVGVQSGRDTTGEAATPPDGAVDTYALPMGPADAPVKVSVYEDFMCPFCGEFEAATRKSLEEYAGQGEVQVQYHPISILDDASNGTDYSTRAMNAAGVVLDNAGPGVAKKFHDLLFENQPEEGSDGLSDQQLIDLAVRAGADESAVSRPIQDLEFEQWVENATDAASKAGVNGTPTVMVDGKIVEATSTIDQLVSDTLGTIEATLKKE
ncbi:MAG TPA: thioredoxin domain-containing protein [Nocardioidaceae bacterium]|nr:thioredoxin domain-containing protein [Nocardioidaceae bacterium]